MNILQSALYLVTVILLLMCLIRVPKYKESANFVDEIVINLILIICYTALAAGILSICKIAVNLISLSVCNILLILLCVGFIIKGKKKQDLYICKEDLFFVLLNIVLIICVQSHIFVNMRSGYSSGDPAVHFQQAMSVVSSEKVSGMYFTPLFNAIIIRICSPFLREVDFYKGMIIADTFTLLLLVEMSYLVIKEKLTGIKEKIIGWILCIFCFLGYPLYSYMIGGFLYLTAATMLFCFLLILLYRYFEEKYVNLYGFFSIMLVLLCLSVTYMLFVPVIYPIVLILLFINDFFLKKGSFFACIKKEFCLFIIPSIWTLHFSFQYWYSGSLSTEGNNIVDATIAITQSTNVRVGSALIQNGGTYGRIFSDFLFFLPMIIFLVYLMIQERKYILNVLFTVLFILAIAFCFYLCASEKLSGYYYYKLYFPMWMLMWFCFSDLQVVLRKQKHVFIPYFASCIIVCMLSLCRAEVHTYYKYPTLKHSEEYSPEMEIYSVNYDRWTKWEFDKWWVNDTQKELFAYVIEELGGEKNNIPLLIDWNDNSRILLSRWYAGMTGSYFDYNRLADIDTLMTDLSSNNKYIVLLYNTDFYLEYGYRFDAFKTVFENTEGKIVELH